MAEPEENPKKTRRGMGAVGWVVLALVLIVGGIGGTRLCAHLQSYDETDDAQADLERYRQLVAKDEISRQQYDQAVAAAKSLSALTDARRASAEAAARNIDAAKAKLQQATVRETEARQIRPQQIQLQNAQV